MALDVVFPDQAASIGMLNMNTEPDTPPARAETDADVVRRLMAQRFSCRGFRPEPVPDEIIQHIFDLARLTPSWCNTQPWQMIVTQPAQTEAFAKALVEQALQSDAVDSDLPFPPEYRGEFLS